MTEAELQEQVRALCGELGLVVQHIYDARRSWLPGWPDIVVIGPGGVLWREFKNAVNSLSPDQRKVGSKLTRAGQDWAVWRPRDWVDGTIRRQLERIT